VSKLLIIAAAFTAVANSLAHSEPPLLIDSQPPSSTIDANG
jgi:hypothetical protein